MKSKSILYFLITVAVIAIGFATAIRSVPILYFLLPVIVVPLVGIVVLIRLRHSRDFISVSIFMMVSLFVLGWICNVYLLPEWKHPLSLVGNVLIVGLVLILGWALRTRKIKNVAIPSILTIGLILIGIKMFLGHTGSETLSENTIDRALRTLPYVSYVKDEDGPVAEGVTKIDPEGCSRGKKIFNSLRRPYAYIMNWNGSFDHIWSPKNVEPNWQYVKLSENRDLLVCIKDIALIKLDWNGNKIWEQKFRCHHDINFGDEDHIYTLDRKDEIRIFRGLPVPILNDYIVRLSSKGELIQEVSIYDLVREHIPEDRLIKSYLKTAELLRPKRLAEIFSSQRKKGYFLSNAIPEYDVLHTNAVTVVDRDIPGFAKKGNVLISVLRLDMIAVVDLEREVMTWSWGPGELDKQHHPTLLENGNILIFDNGTERGYSRVIEFDPREAEIDWEYMGSPRREFFSSWGGSAQRLSNGNTLITESERGRVFEVNKKGEVVWEYYNKDRNEEGDRATLYRMMEVSSPVEK